MFYLLSLVALALLYTAAYLVGMAVFEGEARTIAEALNVVEADDDLVVAGTDEDINRFAAFVE